LIVSARTAITGESNASRMADPAASIARFSMSAALENRTWPVFDFIFSRSTEGAAT
jgi:hypothetical protein